MLLAVIPLASASQEETLGTVVVTAPKSSDSSLGASGPDKTDMSSRRTSTSDSARLLQDVPGVSLYGAGGISSLPVIHGLADDRINVQVNGMELMPACPNHMNSTLSYIDPADVASIKVFAGITPVSVGGDSIGGTIQVISETPEFAADGETILTKGHAGLFYRSNGNAKGGNVSATLATESLNLTYSGSSSQSDNYTAGKSFKPVAQGQEGGPLIPGDVVGSTAYSAARNQEIGLAWQREEHLLQMNLSEQKVGFEGFPNQRMDMTANDNTLYNFRYAGQFDWGELAARYYEQHTRHEMDMGPDRFRYGTGMPMNTKATTTGASVLGNIVLSGKDIFRTGVEAQTYTLYDWWPPVGGTMGPNAFWNVDYGTRNKLDYFGEWEARWNPQWVSQLGVRSDTVKTDAAVVQGYDNGLGMWGADAAAFNALDRQRTDHNWDMTALARHIPAATQTFEVGFARKSRSPNLYQRYPWSTQAMAALMNNFVGDGNGYIGNVDLRPEVASTLSATGDWHDAEKEQWGLKATGYYTYVHDYIDAQRCNFGQCSAANATSTTGFVLLQYANQSARLYGLDLSGNMLMIAEGDYGDITGTGLLNYVRGENLSTGDNLYNIMPLNLKLAVLQRTGAWTNTAEFLAVAAKKHVSQVRNEMQTGGYSLFNLRSSHQWKQVRLDVGIENVFNRFYSMPLGGAYVGQGASMSSSGIEWGTPVPGMGRSVNTALNVRF